MLPVTSPSNNTAPIEWARNQIYPATVEYELGLLQKIVDRSS